LIRKTRDYLENMSEVGRTIFRHNLTKYDVKVWTEFIWLRTGAGFCEEGNELSTSINTGNILNR
jgi:hypothetical protein